MIGISWKALKLQRDDDEVLMSTVTDIIMEEGILIHFE